MPPTNTELMREIERTRTLLADLESQRDERRRELVLSQRYVELRSALQAASAVARDTYTALYAAEEREDLLGDTGEVQRVKAALKKALEDERAAKEAGWEVLL